MEGEKKDQSSLVPFLPRSPVDGLPLNLSRDKAARGIIHLPVPFSISGTLAGTFCPPLKHKIPSVRNSGTHSPLRSFSPTPTPSLLSGSPTRHGKANVGGGVERRKKQTHSERKQTGGGSRGRASISESGREMRRGEIRRGERNE